MTYSELLDAVNEALAAHSYDRENNEAPTREARIISEMLLTNFGNYESLVHEYDMLQIASSDKAKEIRAAADELQASIRIANGQIRLTHKQPDVSVGAPHDFILDATQSGVFQ